MSIVSGVVVVWCCGEDTRWLGRINAWLAVEEFGPLAAMEPYFGGNKHPQLSCAGAGYNHFERAKGEFVKHVLELPWHAPENVVIVIQPEDGLTEVFRPKNWTTSSTGERTDIDRMNWLSDHPDELEWVRGRVNNEDVSVRNAVDYFMRIRP